MSCVWRTATLLNHCAFKQDCIPVVPHFGTQMRLSANHQFRLSLSLSCVNDHQNVKESSDTRLAEEADSSGKDNHQKEPLTTYEVLKRLKRFGISGVLSYGLLNTAYYLSTFLVVWLYVAPVPGKMGLVRAAERFLKVLAMVWAGSQITKLIRAGGSIMTCNSNTNKHSVKGLIIWIIYCHCVQRRQRALALAPVVERGLSWFTVKFKFPSQGKAFMAIAGFCFGLAFLVFFVVTALWA